MDMGEIWVYTDFLVTHQQSLSDCKRKKVMTDIYLYSAKETKEDTAVCIPSEAKSKLKNILNLRHVGNITCVTNILILTLVGILQWSYMYVLSRVIGKPPI